MEEREYVVWISNEERVASFHAEAGYEEKHFAEYRHFMLFLQSLSRNHFRFK